MSSTEPETQENIQYTAHDLVKDLRGLYSSEDRIYSDQIQENEFNTLDAMKQLRNEYETSENYSEKPAQIAGESNWNQLENLLNGAVEKGLLEREVKHVDLPNESFPRKNLFYRFQGL